MTDKDFFIGSFEVNVHVAVGISKHAMMRLGVETQRFDLAIAKKKIVTDSY
jgi:hypothetical protein